MLINHLPPLVQGPPPKAMEDVGGGALWGCFLRRGIIYIGLLPCPPCNTPRNPFDINALYESLPCTAPCTTSLYPVPPVCPRHWSGLRRPSPVSPSGRAHPGRSPRGRGLAASRRRSCLARSRRRPGAGTARAIGSQTTSVGRRNRPDASCHLRRWSSARRQGARPGSLTVRAVSPKFITFSLLPSTCGLGAVSPYRGLVIEVSSLPYASILAR